MLETGFETIGNAILVCHDKTPVLVTDPWITGCAYFGSWGLSHEIPEEVMDSIKKSSFVWVSHGHPDHLSARSLDILHCKTILLPDHVGGQIRMGLAERGFNVRVLKDCQWTRLSDRIQVMSIADYMQDAILLVDINGRLIVNLNDAEDHGWGGFVKRVISRYPISFMLHIAGFGDTDMINFYDEDGNFILPRAARRNPVGRSMARWAEQWGTRYTIPFSSMHTYQRTDTMWASQYATRLSDYAVGWDSKKARLLPPFIRYHAIEDSFEELGPKPNRQAPLEPREFGDNWTEPMEREDRERISSYFGSISHLRTFLDFLKVRFGGIEHTVDFNRNRFNRGLTFEAPRRSFMTCIEHEIFDDILIGNIAKITLHGKFDYPKPLYPDFTPYVTKYADNGRAKSPSELRAYFAAYRSRYPIGYLRHVFESRTIDALRYTIETDGTIYRTAARTYHWLKGLKIGPRTADNVLIHSKT